MAKTQTQTVKTQQNKATNNTPVSSFASYVAKVTDAKQKAALQAAHKAAQEKKAKTAQTKKGIFALVAGTIAKVEHKALKKAIAYHVSKGNLAKVADGIKLTAQGATLWNAERIAPNADQFQKMAFLS